MVKSNNIFKSLIMPSIFFGAIIASAQLLQNTTAFIYDADSDLSRVKFQINNHRNVEKNHR